MESESLCCICQSGALCHYWLSAKNVADCSLSKQNSGTSAGCKSGGQNLEDTDNGKGQETDIGIPLGCENGLGTMLEIFGFKRLLPILCPTTISPDGKKDINTIINKSGIQMTRIMQMLFSDLHAPRHLCFVFS